MDISKQITQLSTLMELSGVINSSLDISEVRKKATEAAARITNSEAGSLLLFDEQTDALYFDAAIGDKGERVKTIRLNKGQGIAGWVAEHRQSQIINDVHHDQRFFKGADDKSGFVTRNMICIPVKTRIRLVGVLEVMNKQDGDYDHGDLELLTALSNQIAIAIENALLYEELKETFYATVHTLAETIEKRDPYTSGHTKRVMDYSMAIGKELGLSRKDMVNLKLAAILHDIGKIGIRDSVLLKNETLSYSEYKIVMMHTLYGADILQHVKQLHDVLPGVKYHHEKFDGSGYPEGLSGKQIPLIARIIAVADSFDAMTTNRPYRNYLSFPACLEELKGNAGRFFDPDVVAAFVRACESGAVTPAKKV